MEDVTVPSQNVTEVPTEASVDVSNHVETVPENLVDDEEFRALTSCFVTVLDESAGPVVGVQVQVVGSEMICVTDETGMAQFSLEEGEYAVSIPELPMGYVFATDVREFAFEANGVTLGIQVRQTFSEPDDLGMEDDMPIVEIPAEEILPEG